MRKSAYFFTILFFCAITTINAQWETYTSEGFNIQFDIPDMFETETGVMDEIPYLSSMAPDNSLGVYVFVYEDNTISTEDLFNKAVNDLGFEGDGEYSVEDFNGLHAFIGTGWGQIDGNELGMILMAATTAQNNYVVYTFTSPDYAEENAPIMDSIIRSFSLIYEEE